MCECEICRLAEEVLRSAPQYGGGADRQAPLEFRGLELSGAIEGHDFKSFVFSSGFITLSCWAIRQLLRFAVSLSMVRSSVLSGCFGAFERIV